MWYRITLSLCLTLSISWQATASADSLEIITLRDSSLQLLQQNQTQEAEQILNVGLEQARQLDHLLLYIDLLKRYAAFWRDKTSTPQVAVRYFEQALQENLWRKAQTEEEWKSLAWLYTNLAATFEKRLGKYAEAEVYYKEADRLFSEHVPSARQHYVAIYVQWPLSQIFTRLGDYPASEALLRRFIQTMISTDMLDRAAEGYNDLGLLFMNQDRMAEAAEAFQHGLSLPMNNNLSKALLLINYAELLIETEELRQAFQQVREAQQLLAVEAASPKPARRLQLYLGGTYVKEATIYQQEKDYEAAAVAFDQALEAYEAYYGTVQRRELGKLHLQRAEFSQETGQLEEALVRYQDALRSVLYTYDPASTTDLPDPSTFYAENTIMEALAGMADTYDLQHQQSGQRSHLERALECHELIFAVEQKLRRSYLYESSKLFTLEESRQRSERAIELALRLYDESGNPAHQWAAFVFAERSRGALLREAFRSAQATDLAGITSTQRAKEAELQYAVSQAEEALFDLQSQEAADSLIQTAEEALLQSREALNRWIRELEAQNPRYFQLKYKDAVPSLADIQSMLSRGQAMIEYFLGDKHLYTFIIGDEGLQIVTQARPDQILDRVLAFRQSIEGYQQANADRAVLAANYQLHGLGLYQDLIAPVQSLIQATDKLLIIPSGILDLLPFEALLSGTADKPSDFRSYPYLLHDYVVSYGYSAGLQWGLHQLAQSRGGWGAYAPSFDGQQAWGQLSCSQDLLSRLRQIWAGETYLADDANRQFFTEHARRFGILHLATHAQSNPDAGDFSFVVFSDGQGGYDSLFTKDLYLLDLEAELVLLSACETALGTLYQSEGVISLARGFHYAGARSVLTTLWSINEGANCHLMESFYTFLQEGQSKNEALRAAKFAYLDKADVRSAHPVYWAGFQLLGNPRPLAANGWSPWWALLLVIPIGYFLYQRRQKEPSSVRKSLASA